MGKRLVRGADKIQTIVDRRHAACDKSDDMQGMAKGADNCSGVQTRIWRETGRAFDFIIETARCGSGIMLAGECGHRRAG